MLEDLKNMFKWPLEKPDVEPNLQGWLSDDNKYMIRQVPKLRVKIVAELGSWLGESTLFICNTFPAATVIAIDHWLGSEEHQKDEYKELLPVLYETFLVNCWHRKDQIVPVKLSTVDALLLLSELKIEPDLIYIDASHKTEDVEMDLVVSHRLFPEAQILGDDWGWDSVRKAVNNFCESKNKEVYVVGNTWKLK